MGVGYGTLGLVKSEAFLAAGIALLMAGLESFYVEAYLTAYWQEHAPTTSRTQFFGSLML